MDLRAQHQVARPELEAGCDQPVELRGGDDARAGRTERTKTASARFPSLDRSDRDAAAAEAAAADAAQGAPAAAPGGLAVAQSTEDFCYAGISISGNARPAGAWGDRATVEAEARSRQDHHRRPPRFTRHAAGRGLWRPDAVSCREGC